jgi:hypothetical protein
LLLHGRASLLWLHSWLIECSCALLDLLSVRRVDLVSPCQVLPHRSGVERPWDPEGPWERSAPISEVDAGQVGVDVRSSTGQATGGVDGECTIGHDDTQQGWLRGAFPAAHTGAHRALDAGH